jgi:ABC-type amino acid transport substrate-binding protein
MTQMKIVLAGFLLATALGRPALGQQLDGTLKKIKESNTFTLGYLTSAPPFSFPGPDKKFRISSARL